ncbi:thioredoxin domain-containing protein [Flavobacteriaceae bacterium F08102]|nr:thioredoxin domain-containing protein [Flavobacteriaceae bacterium F08102]
MKKHIVLCLTLFTISTGIAQGITFTNSSLEATLTKASEDNKLIFIDCYTVWCSPCKKLAAEVFTQKNVGDFYNKNFINLKIDMEKGEGLEIAQYYKVNSYPTLLILNSEGEVLERFGGGTDADKMLKKGQQALDKQ